MPLSAIFLGLIVAGSVVVATVLWRSPRPNRRQTPGKWLGYWLIRLAFTALAGVVVLGSSVTAMNNVDRQKSAHKSAIPATAAQQLQQDAARYFSGAPVDVTVTSYGPMAGTQGAYEATIITYYGSKPVSVAAQKVFLVNGDHWDFGCNIKSLKKAAEDSDGLVFVPLSDKTLAKEFAALGHCPLPTQSKVRV